MPPVSSPGTRPGTASSAPVAEVHRALPLLPVSAERMAGCLVVWQEAGAADRAPRLADLGLGLVLPEGRGLPRGRLPVLDLGSLEERVADASAPMVVLGRVPEASIGRLRSEAEADGRPASPDADPEGAMGRVASLLGGLPFSPSVRSLLLRMVMRDLVRDLDLHDRTAVRVSLPAGGVARAILDTDLLELHLDTSCRPGDQGLQVLEAAVRAAFAGRTIIRDRMGGGRTTVRLRVALPEPRTPAELRSTAAALRAGLLGVLAACEPHRHGAVQEALSIFGARDSLSLMPATHRERVH